MSTGHSPGPWRWGFGDEDTEDESLMSGGGLRYFVEAGSFGLHVYFEPSRKMNDEDRGNLRLIAAAPEMLKLLRDTQVVLGHRFDCPLASGKEADDGSQVRLAECLGCRLDVLFSLFSRLSPPITPSDSRR